MSLFFDELQNLTSNMSLQSVQDQLFATVNRIDKVCINMRRIAEGMR